MLNTIKTEAIVAITNEAGSSPQMVDSAMECIALLIEDMQRVHGKSTEKISDSLYVVRDLEEDGVQFDFWMFCKYGLHTTGQTITAVTTK